MFKLHIVPAQGAPFDHVLTGGSLVVGRAPTCDLTLDDPFLSRQHSRLFVEGGRLFVEDLGSRNGTLIHDLAIAGPTELHGGEVIQISGSVLTLLAPEGNAEAGAAAGTGVGAPGEDANAESGTESGEVPEMEAEFDGDHTVFRLPGDPSALFRPAAEFLHSHRTGTAAAKDEEALRQYAQRLKILNEVHHALGSSISLDALLELILDRIFDHLRPEQGVLFLKRPDGELTPAASRQSGSGQGEMLGSRSLAREVVGRGLAALVIDAQTDERFAGAQSIRISGVRSLLAAPLVEGDGTLGMIVLGSKVAVRQFTEEDMELLVCLASVAALYIRNAALAAEAAERRRLAEELGLARRIQLALLPQQLPELPGYELYGGNTPSRWVSGDYYAVVPRAGSECIFMVADVSGKGMAAALLTASLEAFASGPIEDGLGPADICAKLSRFLYRRTPPEKYATAFLAVLSLETGAVRYANAGHNPPLVLRADGQVDELGATGAPIGLLATTDYQDAETRLEPGDTLILYTDGIVEAVDPTDEEYGLPRLADLCRQHCQSACQELADRMTSDLDGFVRGVPFADDRTLVMARRLP